MNQPLDGNASTLRALLSKQDEQIALLRLLVQKKYEQSQRASQWKKKNPELAKRCHAAATQGQRLLDQMIENIVETLEEADGELNDYQTMYAINEFMDMHGYKFQQFSMILHTLYQLGKA